MAKAKKQKKKKERPFVKQEAMITYRCLQCNVEEEIPEEVVQYFDLLIQGTRLYHPGLSVKNVGEKCALKSNGKTV